VCPSSAYYYCVCCGNSVYLHMVAPKVPKPFQNTGKKTKSALDKETLAEISRANGRKNTGEKARPIFEKSHEMAVDYSVSDMLADIYDPRAHIAPEVKIHAAACFMMTGTVNGAERLSGIDHRTISDWKNNSQWWPTVLSKVRKEKQDELDATLTTLIHKSTDALEDRLENGEEVMTQDGFQKKQLNARDIINSISTLYDKRAMLRGDPTSITHKATSSDVVKELREEFTAIAARAMEAKVVN
jgi:hypothetical protein